MVEAVFDSVRELNRWHETAILYEDLSISYEQLFHEVKRCGAMLRDSLGLKEGERVLLAMHDCPEFIIAFLGAAAAGIVAVPVSTMLTSRELHYVLNHSGARAAIITGEQSEKLESIRKELPSLRSILLARGHAEGMRSFHEALREAAEGEVAEVADDALAFILYTSGSTGQPKGAMHTHRNLPFTLRTCCREVLKVQPTDRLYSSSKLFFAYGLGNSLTFPLGSAATTILCKERPIPAVVSEVFHTYNPTVFFGVPAVFRALLEHAREGNTLETASLKFCVSAGEKLPASIFHEWKERTGLDILDGIGSTEMLQMFISNQRGRAMPGSSGTIVPGYEAKLVDQSGREIVGAGEGNLFIKGGSASPGYWRDPEKTRATMLGEWIRTGDVYRRDEDGFYWSEGRSDDLFKVKGLWVSPLEVEDALLSCPEVLEAAVVAGANSDGTSTAIAHVVLKDGASTGTDIEEMLRQHVRARLASYKCPSEFHFTSALPRTATGKLQRYKLRDK